MAEKTRLVFIDLLRGWALLVMVEVHVVNAFMLTAYRSTGWFHALNFINGLVAPSFIFISGFVFLLASHKKLEAFRTYGSDFWRQIWRISLVWLVGYFLHLPFFSYHRMMTETTQDGWLNFYQSDVLHCIACGLLILFLLRLVIKSTAAYKNFLLIIGAAIVCAAPFLWDTDFNLVMPAPLAAYMNGRHFSLFPLFPWLGFMMFAGYFSAGYVEARDKQREHGYILKFALAGALLFSAGAVVRALPHEVILGTADVRANPFFFIERLGIVMLLLTACWFYAEKRKTTRSFVLDVSRQSLFAYAGHLLVIYGQFWNDRSLYFYYGNIYSPFMCAVWTAVLLAIVIAASLFWDWLKRKHLSLAQTVFGVVALTLVIEFFIR